VSGSEDGLEAKFRVLIAEVVREEIARAFPMSTHHDEYLSTVDAGALAGVAAGTIRRWIREGRLAGHRAGRLVRVRLADLERLLSDGHRRATEMSPEELARRDFG
jgi:excisionase family DNA binding protein